MEYPSKDKPLYTYLVAKSRGKPRLLAMPDKRTRAAQSDMLKHLVEAGAYSYVSEYAHGYLPTHSTYTCALMHCNRKLVLSLDLAHFFPSIKPITVYHSLQPIIPDSLTRFDIVDTCCTHYGLPVGACTSPILSNLALYHMDNLIGNYMMLRGFVYTRYSDDMYFSTNISYTNGELYQMIDYITDLLKGNGYTINPDKTNIMYQRCAPLVCGLNVQGDKPTIRKELYKGFRDRAYKFRYLDLTVLTKEEERERQSLIGLYGHIKGIEPDRAVKLEGYYKWLITPTKDGSTTL